MVTSRPIRLIVSCASAGAPGALYSTRYNSSGNPYMSYTIEGWAADIIRVPRVYQCAEMLRIAFGLGIRPAVFSQFLVYLLSSTAFIGEPWTMNNAGIFTIFFPPGICIHGL